MEPELARVFDLVQSGELILFCGAGMSLYAGYPSGLMVANVLYGALSKDDKSHISKYLPLPSLAQEFEEIKGREELLKLVKGLFDIPPISDATHKLLPEIPQIKTIITTNYDTLFESAFGLKGSVVRNSVELVKKDRKNTEILKIHGDFNNPGSILITRDDYTRFFDEQHEEILWNAVRERLAANAVLFIGYTLEDAHLESIVHKINSLLGKDRKEFFLLAPDLITHKQKRLEKIGITYINGKAEILIKDLHGHIRKSCYEDFDKGLIGADLIREIFNKNDLDFTLESENNRFKLNNIKGISKPLTGNLTFQVDHKNKDFIKHLNEVISNTVLGEVVLDEKSVQNLNLYLNGIRIPNKGAGKLIIKSGPLKQFKAEIAFENGRSYTDLQMQIFSTKTKFFLVFKVSVLEIQFECKIEDLQGLNFQVKIKRQENYGLLKDELQIYHFMQDLSRAGKISMFSDGIDGLAFTKEKTDELQLEAEKYLYYLENLKRVEDHFNFRFKPLQRITQQSYIRLNVILCDMDNIPYLSVFEGAWPFVMTNPVTGREFLDLLETGLYPLQNINEESETFELHGKTIFMGYRISSLLEPYVVNLEEVMADMSKTVLVKSRSETVEIIFKKSKKDFPPINKRFK
jgi:hypothetical protein